MFDRPKTTTLASHARDPLGVGQLPEIAAIGGLGLVVIAVGDTLARSSVDLGDLFFWIGILAIVGPVAWRLLGAGPSRSERLGLVVLLGIALYLVKVLHSPSGFTLYDEIQHLRTIGDIASSGQLFERNPLLLVSPLYPGLEIVTYVLSSVTGTSPFEAGLVVIGAARVLLAIGFFLFVEHAADDARVAGIATFVYMANPNFLFFDAQFGYETLALGLAVLVLYLAAVSKGRWADGAAGAVLVAAGCIVTHHTTTYALIAFLVTWTIVSWLTKSERGISPGPARLALLTALGAAAWLVLVASETVNYLAPRMGDALALLQLVLGDAAARQLFVPAQGAVAPEWERAVAYGSVILLLIALPFGLWRVWREFRVRPIPVVLAIVALSYPVTLAFRLTQSGAEEASRTATFVFMGLAFVVALALMKPLSIGKRIQRPLLGAFAVGAVVLVTGGIIIGTPRWGRLPGPYLPAADTRSIEPEGIDAALWARTELGPGKRIVADRIDRILMGSYGVQDPVTNYANQVRSYLPFFSPTVTPADLQILQAGHVGYLVVDLRLAGVEPLAASYFESGEPTRSQGHRIVLTVADLKKFANVPGVSLVFDSGNIQVYDVRALTSGATP